MGFVLEPAQAKELIQRDPRNREVLFPYLNGEDLNSRPDCSASRWVINFHDWPEEQARSYSEVFEIVERLVKPVRAKNNRKVYRDYWWQYGEKRPAMLRAIADLDRVLVVARVSKTCLPVFTSSGQVMSEQTVVFTSDDPAQFGLLSSGIHFWWVATMASTLETRIRYTPSDVYETLPQPVLPSGSSLGHLGTVLNASRAAIMTERNLGLTKLYNAVHNDSVSDADIQQLRDTHEQIDQAVAQDYGWSDLDLRHNFYETRQGLRHTLMPAIRGEILNRLLERNHELHAAEVENGMTPVRR